MMRVTTLEIPAIIECRYPGAVLALEVFVRQHELECEVEKPPHLDVTRVSIKTEDDAELNRAFVGSTQTLLDLLKRYREGRTLPL